MDNSRTSSETRRFLQHPTELAWADFVDRYGPRILSWCRRKGLDHQACEDVAQEVLKRLHRSMATYNDKQSFRGWLYRVTLNATRDYVSALKSGELQGPEGFEQFVVGSDEVADYLAERDVLAVAMERTRLRCRDREWEVFDLHVLQHVEYDELEQRTGLKRPVLMNYVSSTRKALAAEMAKLNEE